MTVHRLNSKERKEIIQAVQEQFGAEFPDNYYFFLSKARDKIYVLNHAEQEIELEKLRITAIGLYIGQWQPDGFRLTIDGAHLVGPSATKNVVEIPEQYLETWFQGQNIPFTDSQYDKKLVIVKCKNVIIGCAKVLKEELNPYIGKTRRLHSIANEF